MLRIAICDDIQVHSTQLKQLIIENGYDIDQCTVFQSAQALLEALERNDAFDLFFLDIELGAESGIQLAKHINQRFPGTQIIFVTGNIINAVDVGEADHTYFLTKPVSGEKLQNALNRAVLKLHTQSEKRLSLLLRGGGSAIVSSGQIVYCERTKRTTTIVCTDETYYTPDNLDMMEERLPDLLFARPHNSFLVNLTRVVRLERASVHMDNGDVLSISNQRRMDFRTSLSAYLARA